MALKDTNELERERERGEREGEIERGEREGARERERKRENWCSNYGILLRIRITVFC